MRSSLKGIIRDFMPPAGLRMASELLDLIRGSQFEFVGHSWPTKLDARGWDAEGVQDNREHTWPAFLASVENMTLLGITEADLRTPASVSIDVQSLYLAYGYCLGLACREKTEASVLDWGGSVGNYYVIARRLIPGVLFHYTSVDLPGACAVGRKLLPEVKFVEDTSWQSDRYDFVFSSSSLQYLEDWRPTVRALAASAKRYLYITRMPFVVSGKSFVAMQRVKSYRTEYPGWVINRDEFVKFVEDAGMKLSAQFVNHRGPRIKGAPEENLYMGFLFER